ncbi:MAG TPA: ribonuclease HI family protein, partial [Candidatus Saccharimonadia bacterium]|nr:ribonuclease HI family protein [Candidatus Saccharimonadia bacterium]
ERHRRQAGLMASSGPAAGAPGPLRPGPRRLVIRTDGASRNNPGPASCGAVLIDADGPDPYDPDALPVAAVARALGVRTNNVAEYAGLVLALREARRLGAEEIDLRLDSKLIVEQLNGRWRVKDAKLQGLFAEARRHLATFARWSATHEPRARNRAADALANLALDDPDGAAVLVAEIARRNGREPPPAGDTP